MSRKLIEAMEQFCLRVLKGGEDVTPQETATLPGILAIMERLPR